MGQIILASASPRRKELLEQAGYTFEVHPAKADETFDVKVLPAWRPDKAMRINKPEFADYMSQLATVSDVEIHTFEDMKKAIIKRMEYFNEMGCLVSDHGLDYVMYAPASTEEIEKIFEKGLNHEAVTALECDQYKTAFLLFIAKQYKRLGWVMQLHYGCKRDNNTTMYNKLGPDTGYDCISNFAPADQLTNMLDAINENGGLPKTILYSLNPGDDELIDEILSPCVDGLNSLHIWITTIKRVWKNK